MNLSEIAKGLLFASTIVIALSSLTSCGNTMYGFGLDMERVGRRLQTNNDPNNSSSSSNQNQSQGYTQPTPSQNYGGGY